MWFKLYYNKSYIDVVTPACLCYNGGLKRLNAGPRLQRCYNVTSSLQCGHVEQRNTLQLLPRCSKRSPKTQPLLDPQNGLYRLLCTLLLLIPQCWLCSVLLAILAWFCGSERDLEAFTLKCRMGRFLIFWP